MKGISILGSTGSIGQNALEVIRHFPNEFRVVGLSVHSNIDVLEKQIHEFRPQIVSVENHEKGQVLEKRLVSSSWGSTQVLCGMDGSKRVGSDPECQMVISAMVGAAGLIPTLEAVRSKKRILLANKEVLVMAGEPFMKEVARYGVEVLPVDSEHNAIFQCLNGRNTDDVERLILTASGGPFLHMEKSKLDEVSVEAALKHPNWKMGPKITIDSATMMNKGLEMIEAYWLFGVPIERIAVVIHPQSIIHSLVEFRDGSILAQLGVPDMKTPIQYAMSYPSRLSALAKRLNLIETESLTFMDVDLEKFPAVRLAREALAAGGTMSTVLNGANEVAVSLFLKNKIKYLEIINLVESMMSQHHNRQNPGLDEILEADQWVREEALKWEVSC